MGYEPRIRPSWGPILQAIHRQVVITPLYYGWSTNPPLTYPPPEIGFPWFPWIRPYYTLISGGGTLGGAGWLTIAMIVPAGCLFFQASHIITAGGLGGCVPRWIRFFLLGGGEGHIRRRQELNLGVYKGWNTTQLCGEHFINHYKDHC